MIWNKLRSHQKGDTIVEVLICIAILGFVLSASYTLTTRNQAVSQKSQERSQAVSLAESQLERLRSFIKENGNAAKATSDHFCLVPDVIDPLDATYVPDASGSKPVALSGLTGPFDKPQVSLTEDGKTEYPGDFPTGCVVDDRYDIAIWKPAVARDTTINASLDADLNVYAITVRWDRLGGDRDEVKMYYSMFDKDPAP